MLLALSATPALLAQRTPDPAPAPANSETITLSPFEVSTARDLGYAATSTLSGGRLSTELQNTAAAVSVLTRDFLDDLGATDVQEALQWATNSIAASDTDVSAGSGGNETSGVTSLAFGGNSLRVRGIRNATIARNYFPWQLNADNYNTERLDISRGPNALVFGDASLGGIVNVSTKRAHFRNTASAGYQNTSYGGEGRVTLDVNRAVNKNIAVRVAGLRQRYQGWRDFSEIDRDGAFLTATWNVTPTFQLRLEGELGEIHTISPVTYLRDGSSSWDRATVVTFGQAAPPASAGIGTATRLQYNFANPELGFFPAQGMYSTNGTNLPLELRLPQNSAAQRTALVDAPATLGGGSVYPVMSSYSYSTAAAARRMSSDYHTASGFAEKRIGRNLFLEVAGNLQWEHRKTYEPLSANRINIDVTRTLPTGVTINGSNQNPDYLKPHTTEGMRMRDGRFRAYEGRASAVYQFESTWARQKLGLMASVRRADDDSRLKRLLRINGTNPNYTNNSNQLVFRTLMENRGQSTIFFDYGQPIQFGNVTADFVSIQGNAAGAEELVLKSFQVFAAGSWLKSERIHTVVGLRRDFLESDDFATRINDPVTQALLRLDRTTGQEQAVSSPSAGVVVHVLPWLSAFANTSKSFVAKAGGERTATNETTETPVGTGYDIGLKFRILENRVSGSLGYYESKEEHNTVSLLGISSRLDTIHEALGRDDRFNTVTDTQTAFATGYELDLTANLTRNWTLLFNAGKPKSTLEDGLRYTKAFVAQNRAEWTAAAARAGGNAPANVATALADLDNSFRAFEDGRPITNVRTYTANVFTRYNFTRGKLKGLMVGGGVNFYGRNFIGVFNGAQTYSEPFHLVSALVGYNTKVWQRDVRLQLNVSNLLDDDNFQYVNYNVLLQPLNYRIANPREFRFSATARF